MAGFERIQRAITAIAAGSAVVVLDDEDRENEGDLIFAAQLATPEMVAFMVRYTSGYICVALTGLDCARLDLPPMYHTNQDRRGTAYAVTVDARDGVSTGISAIDRARTMQVLADPLSQPRDLTRPGHVVPLRAREGGVLQRPGHTEAAIDLTRMAGLRPVGVLCELVSQQNVGDMARHDELEAFAAEHDLPLITIADLVAYRRHTEKYVVKVVETHIPTTHGTFQVVGYKNLLDGTEHIALVIGEIGDGERVLARVHFECPPGDLFGSLRCDCGPQLHAALAAVAAEGRGVVLYLRGHPEPRTELVHESRVQLSDGYDAMDTDCSPVLPAKARDYGVGAQILADLGIRSTRLLTDNPTRHADLQRHAIAVIEQVPLLTSSGATGASTVNPLTQTAAP